MGRKPEPAFRFRRPRPWLRPELEQPRFSPDQDSLLRACLGRGENALQGWRRWTEAVPLDNVEADAHLLLPLLHDNLVRLGIEHPELERLRGIRRYWWTRNQLQLKQLVDCHLALESAGVPSMVLGAGAIVLNCSSDVALRPLTRIDLLVQSSMVGRALVALIEAGCRFGETGDPRNDQGCVDPGAFSGTEVVTEGGSIIGLRWHLLPECRWDSADDVFWRDAVTTTFGEADLATPNAGDLFLETCCVDTGPTRITPAKVTDAVVIMRHNPDSLDWSRLETLARQRLLMLPLKRMLAAVEASTGESLPEPAQSLVQSTPVSWIEARQRSRKETNGATPVTLTDLFAGYCRYHGTLGFFGKLAQLPIRLGKNLSNIARAAWTEITS